MSETVRRENGRGAGASPKSETLLLKGRAGGMDVRPSDRRTTGRHIETAPRIRWWPRGAVRHRASTRSIRSPVRSATDSSGFSWRARATSVRRLPLRRRAEKKGRSAPREIAVFRPKQPSAGTANAGAEPHERPSFAAAAGGSASRKRCRARGSTLERGGRRRYAASKSTGDDGPPSRSRASHENGNLPSRMSASSCNEARKSRGLVTARTVETRRNKNARTKKYPRRNMKLSVAKIIGYYPPMAYIGRGGATNFEELMVCPAHFAVTVLRMAAAISLSGESWRNSALTSVSSMAKRQ